MQSKVENTKSATDIGSGNEEEFLQLVIKIS